MSGDNERFSWGCSRCKGPAFEKQDKLCKTRNCFGENPGAGQALGFKWAPELRECPWSAIGDKAWLVVDMWREWKDSEISPFGAANILQEEAWVSQGLLAAERVAKAVQAKEQAKTLNVGNKNGKTYSSRK